MRFRIRLSPQTALALTVVLAHNGILQRFRFASCAYLLRIVNVGGSGRVRYVHISGTLGGR